MTDEIAQRILQHFRNGGTLDDSKIAALYRSANGLGPETKTDAAVVGRWAFDAAVRLHLTAAGWNKAALPAVRSQAPRETGAYRPH